jgi:hypothetical protein
VIEQRAIGIRDALTRETDGADDGWREELATAASASEPRGYGRVANRFCIEAERAARHAAIRHCPVARSDLSLRGFRAAGKSNVQASVAVVVSPPEP